MATKLPSLNLGLRAGVHLQEANCMTARLKQGLMEVWSGGGITTPADRAMQWPRTREPLHTILKCMYSQHEILAYFTTVYFCGTLDRFFAPNRTFSREIGRISPGEEP